jgi:hypothetical protein
VDVKAGEDLNALSNKKEGPRRMEEQTLQFRVRQIIVDAFSHRRYAGAPFESLVQPTKSFGVRGKGDTEIFALRLAVGAARAVDEIARELDHRNQAGP